MASKTRTTAAKTDVTVTSAGESIPTKDVVVTDVGAAFAKAATIPASKAAVKAQKAAAKRNAAKPSTKADDRRKLADRVLEHVATMELTDDEKKLVSNWLFGLPMNRDNWPTVLPKPTRGIWVKDEAPAATATEK